MLLDKYKKNKQQKSQKDIDKEYAMEILDKIGESQEVTDCNSSDTIVNKMYSRFGLQISYHGGSKTLLIRFDNKTVLSNDCYISGEWELLLTELYNKLPEFIRRKEVVVKANNKKIELLEVLVNNPDIVTLDFLERYFTTIEIKDLYYDPNHYIGKQVIINYLGDIVFEGIKGKDSIVNIYSPGIWEDMVTNALFILEKDKIRKEHINDNVRKLNKTGI